MRISPTLTEMATYPFVRLEEARRRLESDGVPVIDFGKGDPNEPTDARIREALVASLGERSSYPLAQGLPELRTAVAAWCERRFGVAPDPDREVIPTVGTAPQEFVQRASIVAWEDEEHVSRARETYARKREILVRALESRDYRIAASRAGMYLWVEADADIVPRLLEHGVVVSPGEFFGPSGTGYVRFALVPTVDECARAATILEEVL